MTASTPRVDRGSSARALEDFASRAGLRDEEVGLPVLRGPSEWEGASSAVDWMVLAAEEHSIPLTVVEVAPDDLLNWLRSDVPMMTALRNGAQAEAPVDDEAASNARWLILVRRGDVIELREHVGEDVRAETVPVERLPEEVAARVGPHQRWVVPVRTAPPRPTRIPVPAEPVHPLRRLLRLVRPDRRDLLAVAIFAVAIGVLLLATPIAVQALVNFVALGGAIPPLLVVTLFLFLGLTFAGVLSALQTWVVEILQRRLFVRAVADLSARLPQAALTASDERYVPELVNRFFDLETIQKRGSFLLLDGLSVLLSVLVGLIVLAFYHPLLLAFDVLLLAIIALIVLGPVRRGIRTAKGESTAKYEVAAWLEDIARNPVLFKSSGVMQSVVERSDRLARAYLENRSTHFRVVFGQGLAAIALQVVASTALLGLGGLLVIQGSLTLGQLVAAELILTLVVSSVAKIGKHLEAFYDLMAATDKLGILLDLPVEGDSGDLLPRLPATGPATLAVDAVGWVPPSAPPLFEDVSLALGPGDRVGITGPSGTGKTTLLHLVWGLRRAKSGTIQVDGRDLRELTLDQLRRTACLVDRVELIEGTVRENVHLSRPFVSGEDVRSALDQVGLLEELALLPAGADTRLQVDGRPLSTGQIVRLQVARAIAGRPRLLLVSDFFEELEESEREQVLDVLFDPAAPWTLLMETNASEALVRCGRSYIMEGGELTRRPTAAPAPDSGTRRRGREKS